MVTLTVPLQYLHNSESHDWSSVSNCLDVVNFDKNINYSINVPGDEDLGNYRIVVELHERKVKYFGRNK